MTVLRGRLWTKDEGQDIAEYAMMLAVILVLVVGTIRLVVRTPTMPFQRGGSAELPCDYASDYPRQLSVH